MNKGFRYAILTTIVLLLASCSSTKYVPDGSYLLDEVRIHTDNKEVKPTDEKSGYAEPMPRINIEDNRLWGFKKVEKL